MQWENLTSDDFRAAAEATQVCVIAMGVVERHSDHLPLGTDFLNGHRIACLAAEKEPAVVFPPFYFGQIYEARCFPGTINLKPNLLLDFLWNVFDEIARNGFKKIVLLNAHGGNTHLLGFLGQCALWEEKPYHLYIPTNLFDRDQWKAILETEYHGHACECETSVTLENFPELVHMERVPAVPGDPKGRMSDLPATYNGILWYADHPNHYAGDARTASVEKGKKLVSLEVEGLARYLAAVKADQIIPTLTAEFFAKENGLASY
jgi:creatinine amidohydrolase